MAAMGGCTKRGDLARYLPDGNIEFLGRIDHQVKIRGFRIELGEIEAVLSLQAGVEECVVDVRTDADGNGRLIAYIIAANAVDETDLQLKLKEQLPNYMVPTYYVTLDAMPMTPSGKIDRKALPTPEFSAESRTKVYTPATTETEAQLVRIWEDLLNVQPIGIEDNYFDLGGHSLLAMRIVAHVRDEMGVEISVGDIFTALTIAQLAQQIDAHQDDAQLDSFMPLNELERGTYAVELTSGLIGYPLSPAQLSLWFIDQLEPGKPFYNIPAAYRLTGALDADVLQKSLHTLMQRHESLRTAFASNDGDPVQIVQAEVDLPFTLLDLSAMDPEAAEVEMLAVVEADAKRPFNLEAAPLFRLQLIKKHDSEHILLINMHHIISDGWSFDIYMQELSAVYQAYLAGEDSPLAALPIQYVEFAQWHNEFVNGDSVQKQLDYWQEKLGGAAPVLELPTDRPRPAVQQNQGDIISFAFDPKLTRPLQEISNRAGASMFMTLMSAFKVLLARYTGQEDILVGTPTANRHTVDLENVIGFFINMVALRSDLSGNPTFLDLLAQVRQTALEAYANEDVPFDRLVGMLRPDRDLSYKPDLSSGYVFPKCR